MLTCLLTCALVAVTHVVNESLTQVKSNVENKPDKEATSHVARPPEKDFRVFPLFFFVLTWLARKRRNGVADVVVDVVDVYFGWKSRAEPADVK